MSVLLFFSGHSAGVKSSFLSLWGACCTGWSSSTALGLATTIARGLQPLVCRMLREFVWDCNISLFFPDVALHTVHHKQVRSSCFVCITFSHMTCHVMSHDPQVPKLLVHTTLGLGLVWGEDWEGEEADFGPVSRWLSCGEHVASFFEPMFSTGAAAGGALGYLFGNRRG